MIYAAISQTNGKELRLTLEGAQGRQRVDLRLWYPLRDGRMRPSKQGVSIEPHELPELCVGLNDVLRAMSPNQGASS
ncbi:hypothetical protein ROJ8625_03784 [Roseivivax jejudonensis]|uniref:Transcriptional coactivator p15 (PC4) C-terminal domain-containing protein n=1 Tax=Roseivivax jejudonensis TaxID=1529041 RepID=A0A1X7A6R1_9RHOB|nr:transcriptional coactivator p15/PC4 family protein [Roseivivax jejudonensis]SLN72055.1 hypothetical protein ROJ8625_03784 [Roseivivax jejudonensis]